MSEMPKPLKSGLGGVGRALLLAAMMAASLSVTAYAQSVTVQLVNGSSGKPMAKVRVYIGFDDLKEKAPLDLTTDRLGEVHFDAHGARTFQVHPVGVVACGEQPKGIPYRDYSVQNTLRHGLVPRNTCGHLNTEPAGGRLLYFVRPASWWELFRN